MSELGTGTRPGRRRRPPSWRTVAVVVLAAGVLTAAVWTDMQARARARHETTVLGAAAAQLVRLRRDVSLTGYANAVMTAKRDGLEAIIGATLTQLASTNSALSRAETDSATQGTSIDTLNACLGGVQDALSEIDARDNTQAGQDLSAVAGPCTALAGGPSLGLVYPFDFPDPDVIEVGQTYFAYATNSVAGNIQIIESNDLTHWTAVGNALPTLPAWASPDYTWAPSVVQMGQTFRLYYAAALKKSDVECISVASASQPQGPFFDSSKAPLECQPALGGSLDPDVFVGPGDTSYLVWKSGGPGTSKLWSERLDPAGTAFSDESSPTQLLAPDQPWEDGTVEAPDLVSAGGRFFLFFSGNDWGGAQYAVGVATCSGPLGPCRDATASPVLASGPGMAGPGGQCVFEGAAGTYWIAFDAWIPGAVGFPNSRDLYVRQINLSGAVPVIGAAAA